MNKDAQQRKVERLWRKALAQDLSFDQPVPSQKELWGTMPEDYDPKNDPSHPMHGYKAQS